MLAETLSSRTGKRKFAGASAENGKIKSERRGNRLRERIKYLKKTLASGFEKSARPSAGQEGPRYVGKEVGKAQWGVGLGTAHVSVNR